MAARGDDIWTDTGTAKRVQHGFTPEEDVFRKSVGVSVFIFDTANFERCYIGVGLICWAELIRWADLEVADLAMKQVCNIRWYRPTYLQL